MQQAIHVHFPDAEVEYKFYNRAAATMKFSRDAYDAFTKQVQSQSLSPSRRPRTSETDLERSSHGVAELSTLSLTLEERSWLEKTCPFFSRSYLDFLSALRLDPATQVEATFVPSPESGDGMGDIEILIRGKWAETILYEVCRCLS
jgi:nicotinate phosphoribosyltransferase